MCRFRKDNVPGPNCKVFDRFDTLPDTKPIVHTDMLTDLENQTIPTPPPQKNNYDNNESKNFAMALIFVIVYQICFYSIIIGATVVMLYYGITLNVTPLIAFGGIFAFCLVADVIRVCIVE